MPRPSRLAGLSVLGGILLLSGCMTVNPFTPPEERVDAALRDHQYRRALAIIDDTDQRHPQHALLLEQRDGVLQASQEFRREAMARARTLAAREEWEQAYQVLEAVQDQVVEPVPVEQLLESLRRRHDDRLRDLLNQAYLSEARALLRSESVDQALVPYQDARARDTRAWRAQRRDILYRGLLEQGNAYARASHWQQAQESLETARRLKPEAPAPEALAEARETLHSARNRARDARDRAHQRDARALIRQYQDSGKLDDLLAARTFLLQHQDDDNLASLRRQVDDWAKQRFQDAMARGEALYAAGDYRAAHRLWQSVAPLDPDNPELRKKLERSGKVLNSLRSLED